MGARVTSIAFCQLGLCLALLPAASVEASPQDVIGLGVRSSAMAGAGPAFSEGFEAVYTNPALLSYSSDPMVSLGIVGATFQLEANGPLPTDGLAAATFGAVLPIPLPEPVADRVVLGFGFISPFDLVVRSRILYPETPQFLLPDAVESIAAIAGLGVDFEYFRLGGGFQALAALAGTVLVSVDGSGRLSAVVQDTLVATFAPSVGASVELPYGLRLGANLRGALAGRFDVRIDVKDLGQLTIPPIFVSGTAQYDPLNLEAEIARASGVIRGAVAVAYRRWSDYPGLAEPTVRCPLDVQTFDLPTCNATRAIAPNFSDTLRVRGSFEGALGLRPGLDLDLRAGYSFETAAAPEQTIASNLFAEARSVFGFGVGVDVFEPIATGLSLGAFAQIGVIHGRDHVKEAAAYGPNLSTGGSMFAGGTSLGVAF
jgi:long-chain fatty acid transport protein